MLARARDFFMFVTAAAFLSAGFIGLAMFACYASLQPFPPEFMTHLGRALMVGSIGAVGIAVSSFGIMDDPARSLVS